MKVLKHLVGHHATLRRVVGLMRDADVPSALKVGTVIVTAC